MRSECSLICSLSSFSLICNRRASASLLGETACCESIDLAMHDNRNTIMRRGDSMKPLVDTNESFKDLWKQN